jgi:hypothetical protein
MVNPEVDFLFIVSRSSRFESQYKDGCAVSLYGGNWLLPGSKDGYRSGSYLCFATYDQKMLQNRPRPLSFKLSLLVAVRNHYVIQPYIGLIQRASLSKATKRKSMESSVQTMSLV